MSSAIEIPKVGKRPSQASVEADMRFTLTDRALKLAEAAAEEAVVKAMQAKAVSCLLSHLFCFADSSLACAVSLQIVDNEAKRLVTRGSVAKRVADHEELMQRLAAKQESKDLAEKARLRLEELAIARAAVQQAGRTF